VPNDMTTSADFLRKEDITHRPRRIQGSNFPKEENTLEAKGESVLEFPRTYTLESAIAMYTLLLEKNPNSPISHLYFFTLKKLEVLRGNQNV
jgi:hypothetical protein